MRASRWILLLLIALVPLATLVHRNDLGRWESNHTAMAAPDEFSYLLLADNLLHGGGISTKAALGRDTFYPPAYPLLLAAWSKATGGTLTVFRAHLLNALLLSLATLVVFFLARRLLDMLAEAQRPRFQFTRAATDWTALLIAALFVTSWHVLEGALYVFSEPAFMLATFAWLALGLRWRNWHRRPDQAFLLALLAVAAWSLRGAGIVCVAAMLLFPLLDILHHRLWRTDPRALKKIAASLLVILLLALLYQAAITLASPEKSLAAGGNTDNSYTHQLLHGLTKNGTIHPADPRQWPQFAARIRDLVMDHLDDYAASFTPWFREFPDFLFLDLIGKTLALFGLLGWLYRLSRPASLTRFLELYILLYIALYLVWPFDMTRFWAPILPIMLVYAIDALRQFSVWTAARSRLLSLPRVALLLLALLLALNSQELLHQLGNYERRLNYVSDALASAAATVARLSPNPADTLIAVAGSDEHFLFAWYLPHGTKSGAGRYLPRSPQPHIAGPGTRRETIEELLLNALHEIKAHPCRRLFVLSYFTDPCYPDLFHALRAHNPALFQGIQINRVYQKEIITTVWEFTASPAVAPTLPTRAFTGR